MLTADRPSLGVHLGRIGRWIAIIVWLAVSLVQQAFSQDRGQNVGPRGQVQLDEPLPPGAIARLGSPRFRHGSQFVIGLDFLNDAALVTVGEEHLLHIWDAATGQLLKKISTDPLHIRGFAVSRDGHRLAVAGFWHDEQQNGVQKQVWILDAASGAKIQTIVRSDSDMDRHSMAFTRDGKSLIAIGTSGNLYVDDVATGTEILRQSVPRDNSPWLTLSPDGTTLAISSGPNSGKFFLWRWQSGEEPKELKIVNSRGRRYSGHLAFSPDGKQLAASLDRADFPIHIWNAVSGELLRRLSLPSQDAYLHGPLIFSVDGKSLLAPGWRRNNSRAVNIHSLDPNTGEHQGELNVPAGGHVAMSPDGQLLASTSGTGVRIWKWPRREEVMPNNDTHSGPISRIEVASNETIVTSSDDGTVRTWDAATQRPIHVLRHDSWVRDIAVSPDGSKIASSALDDTVRLWDATSGAEIYRLPGHGRLGGVRAVGFAVDGQSFVSFGDDFYLRRWDVRTGKALSEYKLRPSGVDLPNENDDDDPFERVMRMNRTVVSPDGRLLAIALQKFIVFDANSGQELKQFENPGSHVIGLAFSADARHLLASSWGKPVQTLLADGRVRHSTGQHNPITLWNTATGDVLHQIMLPEGGVGSVVFSRDGRRFAVSTSRPIDALTVYETGAGNKLHTINNLPCRVNSLAFTPDGQGIIGGLADGTAVIWSLPN